MVAQLRTSLLLSPECPYPLFGGGPMRTGSLLHFLAERSAVDLVRFHVNGSGACADVVPDRLCQSSTSIELPSHSKTFPAKVLRNGARLLRRTLPLVDRFSSGSSRREFRRIIVGREWDLAVVEHLWCAKYAEDLRPHCSTVVLDLHNVESELHRTCASSERLPERWAHARFCTLAQEMERRFFPKFDLILTTSDEDRDRVLSLSPESRAIVYPNTIPYVNVPASPVEPESIAFSGNLEYHPNVQALNYFRGEVWPILKKERPGLRWRIIGKNSGRIEHWASNDRDIEVTGPVEDAVEELGRSKIVVVPLLAGSGTRVKIIEAWAASRAVVSTPLGAEGLPAINGKNIRIVSSPAGWVRAVLGLLQRDDAARRLGQEGRDTFERRCSWPAAWEILDQHSSSLWPRASMKGLS